MDLLEQYKALLVEYDKVLNISQEILLELEKKGQESDLILLIQQKKVLASTIAQLTEQIASSEVKNRADSNLRTLSEIKSLLEQITNKAKLIQEAEDKIQKFL